jgi:transcriptional regulator with XRE-family HTH domain
MANAPLQRQLGPTARRVAANVKRLRGERGLDLKGLSARLSGLGQSIGVAQLSKLERAERRVDTDELVALAVALEVSPNLLLLPHEAPADDEPVGLTPQVGVSWDAAWWWATGTRAIPVYVSAQAVDLDHWDGPPDDSPESRAYWFSQANRPHDPPVAIRLEDVQGRETEWAAVREAWRAAIDSGLNERWMTTALHFATSMSITPERITKAVERARKAAPNG